MKFTLGELSPDNVAIALGKKRYTFAEDISNGVQDLAKALQGPAQEVVKASQTLVEAFAAHGPMLLAP